ncbi:MAG: acyl carrier protein [Christensenellaceae bacterium]|nr:acyl carrier protein [Christensenellaceae bacterium]
MNRKDILEKIIEITAEQLVVDENEIDPKMSFAELNADSLDLVEILSEVEDAFGIEIGDCSEDMSIEALAALTASLL